MCDFRYCYILWEIQLINKKKILACWYAFETSGIYPQKYRVEYSTHFLWMSKSVHRLYSTAQQQCADVYFTWKCPINPTLSSILWQALTGWQSKEYCIAFTAVTVPVGVSSGKYVPNILPRTCSNHHHWAICACNLPLFAERLDAIGDTWFAATDGRKSEALRADFRASGGATPKPTTSTDKKRYFLKIKLYSLSSFVQNRIVASSIKRHCAKHNATNVSG